MIQRTWVKKKKITIASLSARYHAASYGGARDYLSPGKKPNSTAISYRPLTTVIYIFSLKVEVPPQPGGLTGWLAFACA